MQTVYHCLETDKSYKIMFEKHVNKMNKHMRLNIHVERKFTSAHYNHDRYKILTGRDKQYSFLFLLCN